MIYDVAIIGSGPASLFAAMEIVNTTGAKVIILEKAKRLNDSRNVSNGWFGGSARSAVKMFVSPGFGGKITDEEIISIFINRLEKYSGSKGKVSKKTLPNKILQNLNNLNFTVDQPNTISYTEEKMIKLGDFLYSKLREISTVIHKINIEDISKEDDVFKIKTDESIYEAKKLILGMGRSGPNWLFNNCKNIKLDFTSNEFDLGFRLEFQPYLLKEYSDKNPYFRLKYGDFKTTIPIMSGTVETEELGHIKSSNGRNLTPNRNSMANFALLKTFKHPEASKEAYRLSEMANVLFDGQLFRESFSKIVSHKTMLSYITEFKEIIEGMPKLLEVFPDFKNKCTVYGPEIRLNTVKFNLSKNMESNVNGLYIVGDMSGYTNSFVQAACSGLLAAQHINENVGESNE